MKRILSLAMSGALLITSIPLPVSAAAITKDSVVYDTAIGLNEARTLAYDNSSVVLGSVGEAQAVKGEASDKSLEEAIKAVRSKISVPKTYSEFDYYFNVSNSYEGTIWNLSWRNPDNGSYVRVACDNSGNIISYRHYDATNKNSGIAKYLKKELKADAEQFIKKIAPEVSDKLEFIEARYDGIYSGNYVYHYQRVENGISFPDNTVSVSVSNVTGEITSIYINWLYNSKVPSADTKISKEKAGKLISDNMDMNLVYRINYNRIYDSSANSEIKAYLVYEPSKNYISVDAKTGEVYFSRDQWVDKGEYDTGYAEANTSSKQADSSAASSITLTDEEIAKLEELNQLISKDEAIKAVTENKYLYIDKNLKAYSANLVKSSYGIYNWKHKDQYVWEITLEDPRVIDRLSGDTYRAYAYATVDAKTGNIISFYASLPSNYDSSTGKWNQVDVPYDRKASQEVLEKFLKNQVKDYFDNSKLVDSNDSYIISYKEDKPIYGGYTYQYQRVNEGVLFPYNSITGSVAGTNGKIYSFNYSWDDNVKFESPKKAMSPEKSMEYYLNNEGYRLIYEVNRINIYDSNYSSPEKYYDYNEAYSVAYEVRLVYRPDVEPYFISPFTGQQLDYDGQVYEKKAPYTYLDISEIQDNRDILLLSDMNIGFEGDYFEPAKSVTKKELLDLIKQVGYNYYEEEYNLNFTLTREEAAKLLIDNLGLGDVAKLTGIFTTGYEDEGKISKTNLGYVALAKGIGLMEAEAENKFNPKKDLTREEAIDLIMNYMKAYKERYY